jgi:hypothetical protein
LSISKPQLISVMEYSIHVTRPDSSAETITGKLSYSDGKTGAIDIKQYECTPGDWSARVEIAETQKYKSAKGVAKAWNIPVPDDRIDRTITLVLL